MITTGFLAFCSYYENVAECAALWVGSFTLADILDKDRTVKIESQEEERVRCYLDTSIPPSYTLNVETSKSIKSAMTPFDSVGKTISKQGK